jgi:hypothetical protein
MRKAHTFFLIQNKLHWHIYRLLGGCTVSEKLLKISLYGPSLIHQLWFLGSQQYPQSGVILTSFSTWGTENSLAEINLESTGKGWGGGVIKCFNIFWGQKLAKTCSCVKWRIIVQQKKVSTADGSWANYSLGMFKDSAIILDAIGRSF